MVDIQTAEASRLSDTVLIRSLLCMVPLVSWLAEWDIPEYSQLSAQLELCYL